MQVVWGGFGRGSRKESYNSRALSKKSYGKGQEELEGGSSTPTPDGRRSAPPLGRAPGGRAGRKKYFKNQFLNEMEIHGKYRKIYENVALICSFF